MRMLRLPRSRSRSLIVATSLVAMWGIAGCSGAVQKTTTPPPFTLSITNVTSSSVSSNGATITWTTNAAANSQVNYGTTANYGQSSPLNSTMETSHSATLTGLSASTTYHFQAKSADASGNQASSSDFTFTTSSSGAAPVISGVTAGSITASGATITWTTNVAANSQVDYGLTAGYGQSTTLNSTLATSHSVNLSGLTASTVYHYRVKSADGSGNLATRGDFTFTTAAAAGPPVISGVTAGSITASGATIAWTTNVTANSQVDYGLTAGYGQSTTLNSTLATSHSVNLSGLTASTVYHYRVKSADGSGNLATSGDFTFTTAASNPGPLSVTVTSPLPGATISGTVTLTATATGSAAVMKVQFQIDGANTGAALRDAPYSLFWDSSTISNGAHSLTAVARDSAGNVAASAVVPVTILNNSSSVVQLTPASSWCSTINGAAPGTTIVLGPGSYPDSCHITSSGTATAPITVRGMSASAHATLSYNGTTSNVIDEGGSFIALRWLTLGPSQDGVDGIRIRGTHDVVIEENLFEGIGGVGVPDNDGGTDTQRIIVRNNTFDNSKSTVMYFGCHDGLACHATQILIEKNLISGGALPGDGVGSGVQIKLNSSAIVRDNTIYGTTGAGIILYGSSRGDVANLAEGNYVEGAQTDAGINVSGGAAIVRNNVVIGNTNFGVWGQDYNGRNLQQKVWIVHNSILNNQSGGVGVQNWQAGQSNVIAFNAITPLSGTSAFDSSVPGTLTGNVTCNAAGSCFDQPTTAPRDLWPLAGGPLIGAAGSGTEPWRPIDDFMGAIRGSAADVGAFQRTGPGSGPTVGGGTARPPRQ